MKVLIVTRSDDNPCVGLVADALRARGAEPVRLDSDLYPERVELSTWIDASGVARRLRTPAGRVDLNDLGAVWYRRFFAGGRLPRELGDLRTPCVNEARRALWGAIAALDAFQLDPLVAVRKADHKELQLRRAVELGLAIPRTLVTTSAADARRFVREAEAPVVTKMQSSFAVWRGQQELVVFTTEVREQDLADADGLRYAPMMFQEKVDKRFDIRATVVGRRVLAARLDSQREAYTATDWRRDGVGTIGDWEPHTLPAATEAALLALVEDFGLNYAAADFVLTPDDRHVFLEINAGGEWFWLEKAPGLGIAEALADTLTGRAPRARQTVR